MLELDKHLTEDELLALRDGQDDDPRRREHLRNCKRCKSRFAFLRAFKSAVRSLTKDFSGSASEAEPMFMATPRPAASWEMEKDIALPSKSLEYHPDTETLLSYFGGAIEGRERQDIQEHILGCERCRADIRVLARGNLVAETEEVRAAREHFREHGSRISYLPDSLPVVQPQLLLGMEDDAQEKVRFRILGLPDTSGNMGPGRPHPDKRIEVTVGTARVTITAHREGKQRFVDVLVRELGRRASRLAANISLERKGKAVASLFTDKGGKASVAVPDYGHFDLRIDGGWELPIFLRFKS